MTSSQERTKVINTKYAVGKCMKTNFMGSTWNKAMKFGTFSQNSIRIQKKNVFYSKSKKGRRTALIFV